MKLTFNEISTITEIIGQYIAGLESQIEKDSEAIDFAESNQPSSDESREVVEETKDGIRSMEDEITMAKFLKDKFDLVYSDALASILNQEVEV